MKRKSIFAMIALLILASMVLAACAPESPWVTRESEKAFPVYNNTGEIICTIEVGETFQKRVVHNSQGELEYQIKKGGCRGKR